MEEAPKPTFQDELEWCISQLETGLLHLNPTPKQAAEETQHILGVLRSQKAPLVKKQQVMHQVFGDYRLKMEEERKKAAKTAMKTEKLQIQPGDILGTVSCKKQSSHPSAASTSWFTPSDNSFQFGFVLSEKNPEEINGAMTETCSGDDIKEQPASHRTSDMLGFSTGRLSSEFAFNFAIPHQSVVSEASSEVKAKPATEIDAPTAEPVVMLEKPTIAKPNKSDVMDEEARRDGKYHMQAVPKLEAAQEALVESKQAELTESDDGLKKRKRKKKKKPLPSETANSSSINDVGKSPGKVIPEHPEMCQSDDQMKTEVDWCIEQLELGLKTQKSTSKQMGEAFRAIKILRSEKAVLAKKRQLMRTMFGDYRAKMAEERRKQLKLMQAASKAAHIAEVTEDAHRNRSQVFWKSAERLRRVKSPRDSFLHPPTSSAPAGTANPCSFSIGMDEVWVVYLCLVLLVIVFILMKQKPVDEIRKEKEKDSASTTASSSYSASSVGKHLECTEEELEASLQRLTNILFTTDARKRESHGEHKTPHQEKASRSATHEHLVDEIEQAVQEAVDTDVYMRKPMHQPAPRRRREEGQWAQMTDQL